ncbi:hypothetical protein DXT90_06775 [Agrobacterium tumefaciens]|nr:hypothetical protein [Agrobacterium tumefaciens]
MREAGAVEIAVAEIEDLRLALQAPKRGGVNDPPIIDVAFAAGVVTLAVFDFLTLVLHVQARPLQTQNSRGCLTEAQQGAQANGSMPSR